MIVVYWELESGKKGRLEFYTFDEAQLWIDNHQNELKDSMMRQETEEEFELDYK